MSEDVVSITMPRARYHALLAAINANAIGEGRRMGPLLAAELEALGTALTGDAVDFAPRAAYDARVADAIRRLLRLEQRSTTCGFPADGGPAVSQAITLVLRDPSTGADESLGEANFTADR